MKNLIFLMSGAIILISSCAPQATCPTYSNAGPKKHHHASHHPHHNKHHH